ncbi:MAG: hypothetical protein AAFY26_21255 [Cyanobacteria bacterium J06638_22]
MILKSISIGTIHPKNAYVFGWSDGITPVRDARTGRFHLTHAALTHEIMTKISLGID